MSSRDSLHRLIDDLPDTYDAQNDVDDGQALDNPSDDRHHCG
jgi:hypothetical protein